MAKKDVAVVESKNAKNAKKKAVIQNPNPKCCGESTILARVYSETGRIEGMRFYCTKCQKTQTK
jgi:ribosomal protein S27AE